MASTLKFDQWQTTAGVSRQTILQVVEATNADRTSASGVGVTIDAVSASITPVSTSSRILVLFSVTASTSSYQPFGVWLKRGSTKIGSGDNSDSPSYGTISAQSSGSGYSAGDAPSTAFGSYIDSPSTTSSVTYTAVAGMRRDDSRGIRLNMSWNYSSYSYQWQLPAVCRMTLLEIQA